MRLFRNSIRKPRYCIYFYDDCDVKYEMNGDRPWAMLGHLMPKFESKDLKPPWQIQLFSPDRKVLLLERDLFLGGTGLSIALLDFIDEAEQNYKPNEYLEEILVDHNTGEQVQVTTKDDSQIGFVARFEALIEGTDHYQEYLKQKEKEFTLERVLEKIFQ